MHTLSFSCAHAYIVEKMAEVVTLQKDKKYHCLSVFVVSGFKKVLGTSTRP